MRIFAALPAVVWASTAWATGEMMPVRQMAQEVQSDGVDTATISLAFTALALVAALWAVHWTIFRRK